MNLIDGFPPMRCAAPLPEGDYKFSYWYQVPHDFRKRIAPWWQFWKQRMVQATEPRWHHMTIYNLSASDATVIARNFELVVRMVPAPSMMWELSRTDTPLNCIEATRHDT